MALKLGSFLLLGVNFNHSPVFARLYFFVSDVNICGNIYTYVKKNQKDICCEQLFLSLVITDPGCPINRKLYLVDKCQVVDNEQSVLTYCILLSL